jgi:predicted nucleotidyltransferase component of viral defense system
MTPSLHQDPEFFREAVLYTAGRTGLSAALVEKDYFCTVLLDYLYRDADTPLVFKGGTSLSKVHADFHRLSEDLDFAVSMPFSATRSARRQRIEPIKRQLEKIADEIPAFTLAEGLAGHNNSTQYIAQVTYASAVEPSAARIKIEIGLREELVHQPARLFARTLLINPFTRRPAVPELGLKALDMQEAYAEKLRAALTRREPAIRDFYDIYYAVT